MNTVDVSMKLQVVSIARIFVVLIFLGFSSQSLASGFFYGQKYTTTTSDSYSGCSVMSFSCASYGAYSFDLGLVGTHDFTQNVGLTSGFIFSGRTFRYNYQGASSGTISLDYIHFEIPFWLTGSISDKSVIFYGGVNMAYKISSYCSATGSVTCGGLGQNDRNIFFPPQAGVFIGSKNFL